MFASWYLVYCCSITKQIHPWTVLILFLSCSSVRARVRPCVRSETLLTRYLAECLTHFTKWDRDEHFTIWGEKIKGQGRSGIKYAGNSTFSRIFTKLIPMMYYGTYECVKFWDQKVTVQGHDGITYAGTVTVQAEYSSRVTRCLLSTF